jgi:hypothetical protein
MQLTEKFASDHKIGFGEAAKVLSSAYADLSAGVGTGMSVLPFRANASGGVRRGADHSSSYDKSSLYDEAKSFVKDSGYAENVDVVERAAHDKQLRTNNEESTRVAENMSTSFDKAESYRTESISSMQKAESYRQASNEAEEHVVGYRQTMDQKLAEYIARQPHPDGSGAITMSRLSDVTSNPALLNRYAERFVQDNVNEFMPKHHSALPSSAKAVSHTFDQNNKAIGGLERINDDYARDKRTVQDHVKHSNLSQSHVDHSIGQKTEQKIADTKQDVQAKRIDITQEGQVAEAEYRDQAGKHRNGTKFHDFWNGINTDEHK